MKKRAEKKDDKLTEEFYFHPSPIMFNPLLLLQVFLICRSALTQNTASWGTNFSGYDIIPDAFYSMVMDNKKEKIKEARTRAFDLYVRDQFVCSEAVLYTIHKIMGLPLPVEIVRLASGFAGGIGKGGCVCGALAGGVMSLGLAFGRSEAGADCSKITPATRELLEWFNRAFGSSCCAVLTEKEGAFGVKESNRCGVMTGETAARTMELILKYEKMSSPVVLLHRVRQALGTT